MLALTLHPSELRKPRHSVRAKIRCSPNDPGKVLLIFEVQGAGHVLWPKRELETADDGCFSGERQDELWKSTCFECFLGRVGEPNYVEWNFAVSGEWASYAFADYRSQMAPATVPSPVFHLPVLNDRLKSERCLLEIEANVPDEIHRLRAAPVPLQASLTAVVIEKGEDKPFYWAVEHWRDKPDFHARESFTLLL